MTATFCTRAILLLVAALYASAAAAAATVITVRTDTPAYSMGAWLNATASVPTTAVLDRALRDFPALRGALLIQPSLSQPVCFQEIVAIEQQIVNGINFRFHVKGCAVSEGDSTKRLSGRCAADCGESAEAYQVTVFCQPWTQTIQVLNLVKEAQREVYADIS